MSNALQRDLVRLVSRIEREDGPRATADPYRQRFHLMPPVGWMNDPNGLCRCGNGNRVLPAQFVSTHGRAVRCGGITAAAICCTGSSCRLCCTPTSRGHPRGVPGSALKVEDGTMYPTIPECQARGQLRLYHGGRGRNTALAVSRDGVTAESNELLLENKDYPADLTCHVRDPKVWAQDGTYYMVLGARTKDDRGELLVYESADKRSWQHINTLTTPEKFGYMWECPDLFELDGKWFLMCSPQGVTRQGNKYQERIRAGISRCTAISAGLYAGSVSAN